MESLNQTHKMDTGKVKKILGEDSFSRLDEALDSKFYARDRFVNHLDANALEKVKTLIASLVKKNNPVILDLMAGWDSHLPGGLDPSKVIGLGLNQNELSKNPSLTEWVIHDLNENPELPFADSIFDVVINTISVDYMTRPVEVFQEVSRILKPGGLFLVIFSNRMFPEKAVKIWSRSNDEARTILVENYFKWAGGFGKPRIYASHGGQRPSDDKYAEYGIPSDPIMAVYGFAEKNQPSELIDVESKNFPIKAREAEIKAVEENRKKIKETLQCPYCGEKLLKWAVPQGPFTEWDNEFMYICFNDHCPYLLRGWEVMGRQGNSGISYRCMYYPEKDVCMPVPIFSLQALRESIVQE
ncbi:MAG TPA: methyltransferase domain-containing protein [Thermodesulfobacteriota bacterium]|nr:methyltransferase domain-containing protein [Thermodesulfobacteriota bacterium]